MKCYWRSISFNEHSLDAFSALEKWRLGSWLSLYNLWQNPWSRQEINQALEVIQEVADLRFGEQLWRQVIPILSLLMALATAWYGSYPKHARLPDGIIPWVLLAQCCLGDWWVSKVSSKTSFPSPATSGDARNTFMVAYTCKAMLFCPSPILIYGWHPIQDECIDQHIVILRMDHGTSVFWCNIHLWLPDAVDNQNRLSAVFISYWSISRNIWQAAMLD